jgi:hypothetical protein
MTIKYTKKYILVEHEWDLMMDEPCWGVWKIHLLGQTMQTYQMITANLKRLNCMEEAVGFVRGFLMFVL